MSIAAKIGRTPQTLNDWVRIGEAGLLAALGVSRAGYVPTEAFLHRALDAVWLGGSAKRH
jgi:hypothetical protein